MVVVLQVPRSRAVWWDGEERREGNALDVGGGSCLCSRSWWNRRGVSGGMSAVLSRLRRSHMALDAGEGGGGRRAGGFEGAGAEEAVQNDDDPSRAPLASQGSRIE